MKYPMIALTLSLLTFNSFASSIDTFFMKLNCDVEIKHNQKNYALKGSLYIDSSNSKDTSYLFFDDALRIFSPHYNSFANLNILSPNIHSNEIDLNLVFESVKVEDLSFRPSHPLKIKITNTNERCVSSLDIDSFENTQIEDESGNTLSASSLSCTLERVFVNNQKCLIDNGK